MPDEQYYRKDFHELPESLLGLLDCHKPVPDHVESFCVHVRDLSKLKWFSLIALCALCLSAGGLAYAVLGMGPQHMDDGSAPMLGAGCIFIAGYSIYFLLRHVRPFLKYHNADFMKKHIARFGYFFTDDCVLARRDFEDCHVIPRKDIRKIIVYYTRRSRGVPSSFKEYVSFKCDAGGVAREVLFYEDQYYDYERLSEFYGKEDELLKNRQ